MKKALFRNSWLKWISAFFILGFALLLVRTIIPYFSMHPDVGFLQVKYKVLPLWHWRWASYIHVFSAIPVILGGIMQFWVWFIKHFPVAHRRIGQVYVFLILFVSAPSGLWMAFYAEGGFWGKFGLSNSNSGIEGQIPKSFENLTNLTALFINDTQLSGSLPQGLTNISTLNTFRYDNNPNLCEPQNTAFQTWKGSISNV